MRNLLVLAAVGMLAGPAWGFELFFLPDGKMNVEAVQRCAAKPFPPPEKDLSERAFQQINICRMMLMSRHAGWVEANPGKPDPVPPVAYMRDDDFKEPGAKP